MVDKVYLNPTKAIESMTMPDEAKELMKNLIRLQYGEYITDIQYTHNLMDQRTQAKRYMRLILHMAALVFWRDGMQSYCKNNGWETLVVKSRSEVILTKWMP